MFIGIVMPAGIPILVIPGAMLPWPTMPGDMAMVLPIMLMFGCTGVRVGVVGEENMSKSSLAAEDWEDVGRLVGAADDVDDDAAETVVELNWPKSAKPSLVLRSEKFQNDEI